MKSEQVWNEYMKSKVFSPETLRKYEMQKKQWCARFTEMPTVAFEINEFITTLSLKDITLYKRIATYKAIYRYLELNYDFPPVYKKIMKVKVNPEKRRYFTDEEVGRIIQAAHEGQERLLILTLYGSDCRIGELGQHKESGGRTYPGLRTDMIFLDQYRTPENDRSSITVRGKTGTIEHHLDYEVSEALIQLGNSNPNGQVFVSAKHPEGMTSKALQENVRNIIARAGITGKKLGPHTLRHSATTAIVKATKGNLLITQSVLGDKAIKNVQTYIHDYQDDLKHSVSTLKLLGHELTKNHQQKPVQPLMITEAGETEESTALVITNSTPESIEQVEAVPDMSLNLFPDIPEDISEIRPRTKRNVLEAMKEAFRYYSLHAPLNNNTGLLSQWMKSATSRVKDNSVPNQR
jgi:site-specific recombinase XerD